MSVVGFDTSNYTTSIAFFNGEDGVNCSKLLPVKVGELGLRQSDAVFHHTKSRYAGRSCCREKCVKIRHCFAISGT